MGARLRRRGGATLICRSSGRCSGGAARRASAAAAAALRPVAAGAAGQCCRDPGWQWGQAQARRCRCAPRRRRRRQRPFHPLTAAPPPSPLRPAGVALGAAALVPQEAQAMKIASQQFTGELARWRACACACMQLAVTRALHRPTPPHAQRLPPAFKSPLMDAVSPSVLQAAWCAAAAPPPRAAPRRPWRATPCECTRQQNSTAACRAVGRRTQRCRTPQAAAAQAPRSASSLAAARISRVVPRRLQREPA